MVGKGGGDRRMTLIIFKGSTCAGLFGDKSRAAEWGEMGVIKLLFKSNPYFFQTPQFEYVFLTLGQTVCRFLRNAYKRLNLGHRLYRATKSQIWGCVYLVCGCFSIWTQTQVWDPFLAIEAFRRDGLMGCKLYKRDSRPCFRWKMCWPVRLKRIAKTGPPACLTRNIFLKRERVLKLSFWICLQTMF